MGKSLTLRVRSAKYNDIYKDIVRVSEQSREGLLPGRVHKFISPNKTAYFILRGAGPKDDGLIRMDEESRKKLAVKYGETYDFEISPVGFLGEMKWAFGATDPSYRIAARLGVLSFFLGLFAFVPVLWNLLKWIVSLCGCNH